MVPGSDNLQHAHAYARLTAPLGHEHAESPQCRMSQLSTTAYDRQAKQAPVTTAGGAAQAATAQLERALQNSGAVDKEALCVIAGRKVGLLDVLTLSALPLPVCLIEAQLLRWSPRLVRSLSFSQSATNVYERCVDSQKYREHGHEFACTENGRQQTPISCHRVFSHACSDATLCAEVASVDSPEPHHSRCIHVLWSRCGRFEWTCT